MKISIFLVVLVASMLPSPIWSYEFLNALSEEVGELYCLNVPSVDGFMERYHKAAHNPDGVSYIEVENLLAAAREIHQDIDRQVNYYAQKEHSTNFTDINYFNLEIYWHIRSIQCQSLHLMFEWVQAELMHYREDMTLSLHNLFDDGVFEAKLSNYIKIHYQHSLDLLNQTDFDLFHLARGSHGHPEPKTIMANLQTMHDSFLEVYTNVTRDVIAPEHESLSKVNLDFTMRAHVMIQSVLTYYHWLPRFLSDYQQEFQKHFHPNVTV